MARSVSLAWDPVNDPSLGGYTLYTGTNSRAYSASQFVPGRGSSTASIGGLAPGQVYFFSSTATTTNGLESAYSNEVAYRVPNGDTLIQIAIIAQAASKVEGPYTNYAIFPVLMVTNVAIPSFFRATLAITTDGQLITTRYPGLPVIGVTNAP